VARKVARKVAGKVARALAWDIVASLPAADTSYPLLRHEMVDEAATYTLFNSTTRLGSDSSKIE
jgi:hypothetical protein